MISIILFYCSERLFMIGKWVIEKNSMKPLLPEKEAFYNHLNMRDITDSDYTHGKRVCKDF